MRCKVWNLGFSVQRSGFVCRFQVLGVRVQNVGFKSMKLIVEG